MKPVDVPLRRCPPRPYTVSDLDPGEDRVEVPELPEVFEKVEQTSVLQRLLHERGRVETVDEPGKTSLFVFPLFSLFVLPPLVRTTEGPVSILRVTLGPRGSLPPPIRYWGRARRRTTPSGRKSLGTRREVGVLQS